MIILIFWTKFAQERHFQPKNEKVKSTVELFRLVEVSNRTIDTKKLNLAIKFARKTYFGLKI